MFMKKIGFILTGWICFFAVGFSQPAERRITPHEYIAMYKDEAIKEMLLNGIPASITLAQGMLESDFGNSPLARYANNHFGIKCHNTWEGPVFIQDDDEKNECFRKYYTVYQSFKDHSEFLKTRSRYAFLFEYHHTDYKAWAKGLKKAGYATNPKYADLLISMIERYELHKYDKVKHMPKLSVDASKQKTSEPVTKTSERDAKPMVKVHENNIKYTIARKGDTFYKIAKRHEMGVWQILKYNDYDKGDLLKGGEIIYLQPKRNKAKVAEYRVQQGESLHDISQKFGVKLKKLYRYNGKLPGWEPTPEQVIRLR